MQTELAKDENSTAAEQNYTYDEVPYESFPYDYTQPENLCVLGRLFKIEARDPAKSRILEIGCASGGNLIPVAIRYPQSECVGIDLSSKQVNTGNQVIGDLGLKNISLKHLSIDAAGSDLGKFDYIICHGVLSWVTEDIQDRIFDGCKELLSENGLAMLSYNTLPGWNAVRSVRDMMLYHAEPIKDPNQKISQCRAFLNFILNNFEENSDDPYYKVIKKELEILDATSPSYFFHDHLEGENRPMYFHQFCQKTSDAGLQYVSNTDLRSMYIGNYKPEVAKFLEPINQDVYRTEQYLDFISNRRFRSSIVCHQGLPVNRNIDTDEFSHYYVSTDLRPETAITDAQVNSPGVIKLSNGGLTLNAGTKLEKTILKVFAERHYRPVSIENLAREMQKELGENNLDQLTKNVSAACLKLLLAGAFTVHLEEGEFVTEVTEKPRASRYAQYQSRNQAWVTNLRCKKVALGVLERTLLPHLDGSNDFSGLVGKILEHVRKGELNINENNQVITDKALVEVKVRELLGISLQILAQNALLVGPETAD